MPAYTAMLSSGSQEFARSQGQLDAPPRPLAKRGDARRIVLLAGDLAAILADYLEYQITLLGLPVFTATSAGRIAHLVRTVNQRDLVLAISFRRGLRQTVEGVHSAHARNAYCVGITDTYVSPLARECDEVFLASVESTSYGASYAAPVALVNAILAACGQYRRPQTMAILKEIVEEQRKGFRWYTVGFFFGRSETIVSFSNRGSPA
jgi:DNA-binding MurR/RpiR family transcriptional regulator